MLGLQSLGSYQAKLSYEKLRCIESETKCSLFEYKVDNFAPEVNEHLQNRRPRSGFGRGIDGRVTAERSRNWSDPETVTSAE